MKEIASTKEIPDQELSKAVAVAIMGWILCDEWRVDDGCCGIAKHCEHDRCFPAKATVWSCPPDYAGDIALAMQVVEKMQERDFEVSMHKHPEDDEWWVVFSKDNDTVMQQIYTPSLPYAICKCALAALEATKEKE